MNEITSSKKIMYRLLLAAIIILMGYLSLIFFNKYDSHSYIKAENIVFAIVLLLIGLGCLLIYASVKDITITATQVEFKSFLDYKTRTLRLSDIKAYTLQVIPNKYGKDREAFTLFTKEGEKIKIKGNLYSNYDELKGLLSKNVSRDEKLEVTLQNQNRQKASLFMTAIGIIILTSSYLLRDKEVKPNEIVYIKDIAADNITEYKGRKGNSSSLTIDLMKYPDFRFKISGLRYNATDSEVALREIHTWDSIMIGIPKEDFDKKISKTVTPNFFDIYFGYKGIAVYELRDRNYEFLSVANYNGKVKKHFFLAMGFFSFLGILFMVLGIFNYFKAKRNLTEIV